MATIDLSETEAIVLHEVMQTSLSELRSEISHTDDREFKTALKERQTLLEQITERLGATIGQTA